MSEEETVAVSGSLDCSIRDFVRRCKRHILDEQSKISPDNALISTLCDAVRLAREYYGDDDAD